MNVISCRIRGTSWIAVAIFGVAFLTAAVQEEAANAEEPNIAWNSETGQAVLTFGGLELVIETKAGLNARSLRDVKSGQVFADRDYEWPRGEFPKMETHPEIKKLDDGSRSISLKGRLGPIEVEQVFTLPKNEPGVLLEDIAISNPTESPVETKNFKCGFTKCIREGEAWTADIADVRFSPVPYRRETNGQMQEFPLREVAEHGTTFVGWMEPPQPTPIWGAEGWVWSFNSPLPKGEGTTSFLLAKHNPEGMEWSLMEPVKRGTETALRFGGAGQWKHGHPEGSAQLGPGKSYRFGQTRLQAVAGDWKQAFYAYRGFVESKGCRISKGYNPPVHWNELYDNEYFFKVGGALGDANVWYTPSFNADNEKLLKQYYSLDLMLAEAAKAKELGCEALYMDPGWDTGPSHHLWDSARLGSMESFLGKLKNDYGLMVSLWIGTGGMPPTYADPEACPPDARVVDKDGKQTLIHCFASPAFLDTKGKRLLELCRQGIAFMMFDSTQYSGPCYDKAHGHSIPSTREEHANALLELVRRVKVKYPNVLIELHDPITGPGGAHYTPAYFGYARPNSFDCLWGHEFMWGSKDDLLSGRAISLYYYNLAYSIPIYLHINLKEENENALLFWWYASTCRHLGVGGKPGPAAWEACKKAMQTYKSLKKFYTTGEFYGIEETVHAHTLPDIGDSVINVFNLGGQPLKKQIRFRLKDIGLADGEVKIEGAESKQQGDEVILELTIPARGHSLINVHGKSKP